MKIEYRKMKEVQAKRLNIDTGVVVLPSIEYRTVVRKRLRPQVSSAPTRGLQAATSV